tara:strand:- start:51 stop:926 length:876 start_codon:yes stop_codon:yes gene_type:complete
MAQSPNVTVWSGEPLSLGEGPLTNHLRGSLVWFDINGRGVYERRFDGHTTRHIELPLMPSAAGLLDDQSIVVATEDDFRRLNLETGAHEIVHVFPEDAALRANDGRVHPSGAFWIGTMSKDGNNKPGAIWRLFEGELTLLIPDVIVPNSICFAADGSFAYYADSGHRTIWKVATDPATGALTGEPEPFVVFDDATAGVPDGSVTDADNVLWNARWGGSAIDAYDTDGNRIRTIPLPVRQPTCPSFVGADLSGLVTTSARAGIAAADLDDIAGTTLQVHVDVTGKPEPIVKP